MLKKLRSSHDTVPFRKHKDDLSCTPLRCSLLQLLCVCHLRLKVERQVKVLVKNLAIFFLFTSREFLPILFKKFVCLLCHYSPSSPSLPPHTVCTHWAIIFKTLWLCIYLKRIWTMCWWPSWRDCRNWNRRLQKMKQEWQKSPAGTRQTDGKKLVWFGEEERKIAKLSKTTLTDRSSS